MTHGRSWPPRGESATARVRRDRGYPCPAVGREGKPFSSPLDLGFGTCRFSGATHDGPLPIISAPDASERGSGQGHDITPKLRLGRTIPAQTPLPEAREGSRATSWALEAQRPSRRRAGFRSSTRRSQNAGAVLYSHPDHTEDFARAITWDGRRRPRIRSTVPAAPLLPRSESDERI
jgi:hypothetical protein